MSKDRTLAYIAMSDDSPMVAAREVLRRAFGHRDFRTLQEGVIGEVLAGRNVIAVLPTGGGKSLCYQIPSLIREGLGIVVSPLIALMADQVAALQIQGVAAARLDSNIDPDEREETWTRLENGTLNLLYLSPEGLMRPGMLERLSKLKIALLAIDEAHCVSQWGHDFRPEYRTLGRLAEVFPGAPRIAVTATADARTREDIRAELRLGDAREFVDSFQRSELLLSAERKEGPAHDRIQALVDARPNRSGVIYAGSRSATEALAERLQAAGSPAQAYHAGLDRDVRSRRLAQFLQQDNAVMVATIAFGMGIDKPNVRYVLHTDPPASIEAYWQEVGRGGRDGLPAEGVVLYGAADFAFAMRRIEARDVSVEVKQVQVRKLRQFYAMLEGITCRAAAVRRYFGEAEVEACGQCDLCLKPPVAHDVTRSAQMALSAAHRLGGRFGRGRLIDHLLGKTKDAFAAEVSLSTFGVGRDVSAPEWRRLLDHLLFEGLLQEDPNDGRPLVRLGDAALVREIYQGARAVQMRGLEPHKTPSKKPRAVGLATCGGDEPTNDLFEALRLWRKAQATAQALPPYVIFHDKTLAEIAKARPSNLQALSQVSGVGQGKLDRYGAAVLELVGRA